MTSLIQKSFWLLCAILLSGPGAALAASQAVAVVDDGYAGKVLSRILDTGKLKFSQAMELRLSLDDQGHLLECRASKGADAADACAAAKAASPFGTPPYGVPTYVTLALWSDRQPAAAKEPAKKTGSGAENATGSSSAYLAKVRRQLRDSMYIPAEAKPGTYHVTVRIRCDSAGKILDSTIVKGSGDKTIDKYCLQGIKRAGRVDPPPHGAEDTFELTFALKR